MLESPFNRFTALRPATILKRDSNTGKHLCWSPFLRKLQVLKPANLLKGEYCKIFKNTILVKICEQLLLQFLLLTVNISFWVLVSALNSIGLLQRSSSRFKKFSLGCLVVGSPFIWKKKRKISWTGHSFYQSLSLVATCCTTRCHSIYHSSVFLYTILFILKAHFVLKIFKLFSRLFGHVRKKLKKDEVDFEIHDVTAWLTNNYKTHIAQ